MAAKIYATLHYTDMQGNDSEGGHFGHYWYLPKDPGLSQFLQSPFLCLVLEAVIVEKHERIGFQLWKGDK